jgi:hypothetical protein
MATSGARIAAARIAIGAMIDCNYSKLIISLQQVTSAPRVAFGVAGCKARQKIFVGLSKPRTFIRRRHGIPFTHPLFDMETL